MSSDESEESADLDPIDEELIAYLDGEIDATGRLRVERRLAEDAAFRERLRRMQQAWEALDLLPRASAGEEFTSSTMTLVVAEQEVAATQAVQQLKSRQGRHWRWGVAATVAAVALGFGLVYRTLTTEDQALVKDLPVIERVDQLHNTPSVEFLTQLQQEGLFLADTDDN
jgi:anti-sigma factor RsiW